MYKYFLHKHEHVLFKVDDNQWNLMYIFTEIEMNENDDSKFECCIV